MADSTFIEKCLKHHNVLRALHQSPELQIDIKLNDFAQDWALTLADKDIFEHRQENDYGENLYVGYNSDPEWSLEPNVPVESWYSEISSYKFGEATPDNLGSVGHFTQLVWKATEKLGIGKATSKSGKNYVVCNYAPAGNIVGEFNDNVLTAGTKEASQAGTSNASVAINQQQQQQQQQQQTQSATEATSAAKNSAHPQQLRVLPTDELRVWSNWLTMIADTAIDDWDVWLVDHLSLIIELINRLRMAEEQRDATSIRDSEKLDDENAIESTDSTTLTNEREKNQINYVEAANGQQVGASTGSRTLVVERDENGSDAESKVVEKSTSREKSVLTESSRVREHVGESVDVGEKVKSVQLPEDKCEMIKILKEFHRKAKKYQSLYNHWQKVSNKVIEEIADKPVEVSNQPSKLNSERRLLFFLENELEETNDQDEEATISNCGAQSCLEMIAYENFKLYFNLTDRTDDDDDDDDDDDHDEDVSETLN